MRKPREIATWRFEQIAPFLDASLNPAEKRRVMKDRCRLEVEWPNGKKKRVPKSTLHRWRQAFEAGGYLGLMPAERSDKGKPRNDSAEWIDYAIALLFEQPSRSLFQLESYLSLQFEGYDISRSTLSRHLHDHPAYPLIEKLRGGGKKLRGRYEANRPHESWQLDGKGPFRVRLMTGEVIHVVILTVLDDYSRAVLGTVADNSENSVAACRVFQKAAERYGLPDRMQFDHGSAFDGNTFRHGLAQAGVHRNAVKVKNPQAQGKIEAYHKALGRWFIDELKVQEVRDIDHLQELLDAAIALLYQKHRHSETKATPEERLGGKVSARRINEEELALAFFVDIKKKSDRITGEVLLPIAAKPPANTSSASFLRGTRRNEALEPNGCFRVPLPHAGKRASFRYDPLRARANLIVDDRITIELTPFEVRPLPPIKPPSTKHPQGQLQKLVDRWKGREVANAELGFGLPEVFAALKNLVGRSVPETEAEGRAIIDFWNQYGPLAREPFETACARTQKALGDGRPLSAYLADLGRQIQQDRNKKQAPQAEPGD